MFKQFVTLRNLYTVLTSFINMDKSPDIKGYENGNTYEMSDFDSDKSPKHVSEMYETLDAFNSDLATATANHSADARCEIVDDHDARLIPTNKSNRKKLVYTAAKIAFVAILLVSLSVVVVVYLSSRKEGKSMKKATTVNHANKCMDYSLVNGKVVNATGLHEGDSLQLECNSASKLVGSATVTCYSTGQWSDYPRCIPKECIDFVAPPNGKVIFSSTSTNIGATILVTCEEGFVRKGTEAVVCQSNETWSDSPSCEPVDCGMPKNIENGEIRNMTGTTYNNTYTIVCSLGYQLTGVSTVICQLSGLWGETPVCKSIACDIPSIPKNGHIKHLEGYTFGSAITLQCDEGFFIKGNPTISCTEDGNWTSLPTCGILHNGQDCGDPSYVANGEIKGLTGTKYNDSFSVECNENYTLVGPGTVVCDTNGNWTNVPACIAQTDCGVPPGIENGAVMGVTDTNTFYVKCNNGYHLTGENTLTCDFHGTWSTSPNCQRIDCGLPRNIANGEIKRLTGTKFNSTFSVECKKGYVLTGSTTVECKTTGSWSEYPACISQTGCGVPPNVANGEIRRLTSTNNMDVFAVQCYSGFDLLGNATVTCGFNGIWTNMPSCNPVSCGIPKIPENQRLISFNGTAFQSTARMECDEGLIKEGNSVITCLSNGSWSWISPCGPIDCGTPKISNGIIKRYTNASYGSIFYVACDETYSLIGSMIVQCGRDGQWNLPSCKRVPCGLPEIPENGAIDSIKGTMFNRTVSISCNSGFVINGTHIITCFSHGEWSKIPICRPVTDCYDIYLNSNMSRGGIYNITLWHSRKTIQVYCDMDTDGGGWTVFQYRYDGSVDFYNTMLEYENGFGSVAGEFWLGLKYIQEIAWQGSTTLRIDMSAANGTTAYETFQNFYLHGIYYVLRINRGAGTAGDNGVTGLSYNFGQRFSTQDRDYDSKTGNCAKICRGAWWYKTCSNVDLNGEYLVPGTKSEQLYMAKGMVYLPFTSESLKSSKMMIRRG